MAPPVISESERRGLSSNTSSNPSRRIFNRAKNRNSLSDENDKNQLETAGQQQKQNPDDEMREQIIVTILDSAHNRFTINLLPDSTVLELKQRGHEVHSIIPEQQRLISMGQLLQDDKLIADHNIVNGSIVHLFPKPNVVITESNNSSGSQGNTNSNANVNANANANGTNYNNNNSNPTANPGAHVPQILMDSSEVDRQSSVLILSTHEAYETLHRIRLLSFLLLMYSAIHMLRDISIYVAPPMDDQHKNTIIPPGDPTDTSMPGTAESDYDEELPQWQNRDFIEMTICGLAMYVALLGIRVTSEQISISLVRRFGVLLFALGISWNGYLFYVYVDQLRARESEEDYDDGKVFSDALFAIALPFILWAMFFLRAVQLYLMVKDADDDAQRRTRTLASAIVAGSADGNGRGNNGGGSGDDGGYDLELQVSNRSLA